MTVLDYLLDRRFGIVRFLIEVRRDPGAPEFFHYAARASNTAAFTGQRNFSYTGGASADRSTAMAKAVGEAVERYCAAIYDVDELPLSSWDSASFPCTYPSEFALYSPEQYGRPGFPWVPFEGDTPVRWAAGTDLSTGEPCYVPAARVFVPYHYYVGTGDAPIDQPISTGLACYTDRAGAAVRAVLEVVERDAVMITWQAMLPRLRIRQASLDEGNLDLIRRFEAAGSRVELLSLATDHGIPAVLAVLRTEATEAPALVFAGSAALDPGDAVRHSLEELAHTRLYANDVKRRFTHFVPEPPDHENVIDQVSHLSFYADHDNVGFAEFIFGSGEVDLSELGTIATGDPRADLDVLAARISSVGERVVLIDLTTPDVADLGLSVVRAVVPGFQPLHMGFQLRSLGGRRLAEVPARLGFEGRRHDPDNPAPHPYP